MRAVLHRTNEPRVVAEQQTCVCLQAISAHKTGVYPRAILQWTINPRVVANWKIDLNLLVTSMQWPGVFSRAMS